jgi:hypothetical protein
VVKSELNAEKLIKALHFTIFVLHTKIKLEKYINCLINASDVYCNTHLN